MIKDNSEKNTTSPKISGNERNKATLAYFTTFLSVLLPIGFGLFLFLSERSFPSWANILYPLGGTVGALICGLIYWRNTHISKFVSNHSAKAAKINIVCTVAIILIAVLFFNSLDGPEALLSGMLMLPFIYGGPLIGLFSIISIYTQKKNL